MKIWYFTRATVLLHCRITMASTKLRGARRQWNKMWNTSATVTTTPDPTLTLLSKADRKKLHWYTLSPHFNGHFPGEPWLAGVYWSKGWWRWWQQLDYGSCKSCKAAVKSSPPTNQHPVFYRPDALPVTQPTVSKHWKEKYHIPWTCLLQAHLEVFQLCLWPVIAPGYLGGGLPCLSSALWCQYPIHWYTLPNELRYPRVVNGLVWTEKPLRNYPIRHDHTVSTENSAATVHAMETKQQTAATFS